MTVPCWFPIVDLPPAGESKYTIYFTRGVRLEAEVMAHQLKSRSPKRVLQVYRDDYVGRGAAQALKEAMAGSKVAVEDRVLEGNDGAAMSKALDKLGPKDVVMFWLRADDFKLLDAIKPPKSGVYLSSKMGGGEAVALPPAWKAMARLVYPYQMPDKRVASLAYFNAWLRQRHIPHVDEFMQSEAYFAVAYLTDTVTEMLDNLYRDYLIERAENMISRREGAKAETEFFASTMARLRARGPEATPPESGNGGNASAPPSPANKTALELAGLGGFQARVGTTAYPRLSLGPGQRFASKGAYIVHFDATGNLVADTEWIVP